MNLNLHFQKIKSISSLSLCMFSPQWTNVNPATQRSGPNFSSSFISFYVAVPVTHRNGLPSQMQIEPTLYLQVV